MRGFSLGLLKGSGALLVAALTACGGRSSPLEPDAIDLGADEPSTGGSAGKNGGTGATSSGGTAATSSGGAGATSSGNAGGTSSGGVSGSATAGSPGKGGSPAGGTAGSAATGNVSSAGAPSGGAGPTITPPILSGCKDYCSVTTQGACPSFNSFQECYSTCTQELSAQPLACQEIAAPVLTCLTAAYRNGGNCDELNRLQEAKCSSLLNAYQTCVGPGPVPQPVPDPLPSSNCSSSGSSGNGACSLGVKCDNGAYYYVSCYGSNPEQSSCTCNSMSTDGSGSGSNFTLNESTNVACYDSFAVCGFPQQGLK